MAITNSPAKPKPIDLSTLTSDVANKKVPLTTLISDITNKPVSTITVPIQKVIPEKPKPVYNIPSRGGGASYGYGIASVPGGGILTTTGVVISDKGLVYENVKTFEDSQRAPFEAPVVGMSIGGKPYMVEKNTVFDQQLRGQKANVQTSNYPAASRGGVFQQPISRETTSRFTPTFSERFSGLPAEALAERNLSNIRRITKPIISTYGNIAADLSELQVKGFAPLALAKRFGRPEYRQKAAELEEKIIPIARMGGRTIAMVIPYLAEAPISIPFAAINYLNTGEPFDLAAGGAFGLLGKGGKALKTFKPLVKLLGESRVNVTGPAVSTGIAAFYGAQAAGELATSAALGEKEYTVTLERQAGALGGMILGERLVNLKIPPIQSKIGYTERKLLGTRYFEGKQTIVEKEPAFYTVYYKGEKIEVKTSVLAEKKIPDSTFYTVYGRQKGEFFKGTPKIVDVVERKVFGKQTFAESFNKTLTKAIQQTEMQKAKRQEFVKPEKEMVSIKERTVSLQKQKPKNEVAIYQKEASLQNLEKEISVEKIKIMQRKKLYVIPQQEEEYLFRAYSGERTINVSNVSQKNVLGLSEKTVNVPRITRATVLKSSEIFKPKVTSIVSEKAITIPSGMQRTGEISRTEFIPRIAIKGATKQISKTLQIQKQKKVEQIREKSIILSREDYEPKNVLQQLQGFAFNVFVRQRGKQRLLNKSPLTKESALNFGHYFIENTPARSFFVSAAKGKPKQVKTQKIVYSHYRPPKFNSKLNRASFVEKSAFAINTRGEKQGLSFAKLAKQSRNKQLKQIFGLFSRRQREQKVFIKQQHIINVRETKVFV